MNIHKNLHTRTHNWDKHEHEEKPVLNTDNDIPKQIHRDDSHLVVHNTSTYPTYLNHTSYQPHLPTSPTHLPYPIKSVTGLALQGDRLQKQYYYYYSQARGSGSDKLQKQYYYYYSQARGSGWEHCTRAHTQHKNKRAANERAGRGVRQAKQSSNTNHTNAKLHQSSTSWNGKINTIHTSTPRHTFIYITHIFSRIVFTDLKSFDLCIQSRRDEEHGSNKTQTQSS